MRWRRCRAKRSSRSGRVWAPSRARCSPGAVCSRRSSSTGTSPRAGERHPGLDVVEADVLTVDFAALGRARGDGKLLRIVGNLPYNISTPILFHLLESVEHIADQHVMLQKEVVDRMVAAPHGKDYGRLSVMLQWRYEIEHVLDVPPESFDPPPRVDSAVVRMTPKPAREGVDAALLEELVRVAFSQRRKLLRHTLGRWLEARGAAASFDTQRRAEEVPVDDYLTLAASL